MAVVRIKMSCGWSCEAGCGCGSWLRVKVTNDFYIGTLGRASFVRCQPKKNLTSTSLERALCLSEDVVILPRNLLPDC